MKTFVAAEIGSNWEGSLQKAKKIIKECKNAGADAVKFQMWRAEDLYKKSQPNWNDIKKSELSFQIVKKLKDIGLISALVIDGTEIDPKFFSAANNIKGLDVLPQIGANVYDILRRDTLVLTKDAVNMLQERLK